MAPLLPMALGRGRASVLRVASIGPGRMGLRCPSASRKRDPQPMTMARREWAGEGRSPGTQQPKACCQWSARATHWQCSSLSHSNKAPARLLGGTPQ